VKPVHVIGVPLDLGGNRRGVDMGPSAFRIAGLAEQLVRQGHTVVDKGDLPTPIPETTLEDHDAHKKYIRAISLREAVERRRIARRGRSPSCSAETTASAPDRWRRVKNGRSKRAPGRSACCGSTPAT
jgi:arginase family enzyme